MDFVDVELCCDNELFIDPCLIETVQTNFCRNAYSTMMSFFDTFYTLYRNHSIDDEKLSLFEHAREINATKLGYGNGENGKGNTPEGMLKIFKSVDKLFEKNICLCHPIDLHVLIKDFAEDGLSDMLTNILFNELNEFTLSQCEKYQLFSFIGVSEFYYWDKNKNNWCKAKQKSLIIDGKVILLVPKNIVRRGYYYNLDQYFRSIILERIQQEETNYDENGKAFYPTKMQLRNEFAQRSADIYMVSLKKTHEMPDLLNEYLNNIPRKYINKGMSDEDLDVATYSA